MHVYSYVLRIRVFSFFHIFFSLFFNVSGCTSASTLLGEFARLVHPDRERENEREKEIYVIIKKERDLYV